MAAFLEGPRSPRCVAMNEGSHAPRAHDDDVAVRHARPACTDTLCANAAASVRVRVRATVTPEQLRKTDMTSVEHCDAFAQWLKDNGCAAGTRSNVVRCIAEKANSMIDGIYNESEFA